MNIYLFVFKFCLVSCFVMVKEGKHFFLVDKSYIRRKTWHDAKSANKYKI
jgi:hypothetical protein